MLKKRANLFKDKSDDEVEEALIHIVDSFGINWLEREKASKPLQSLWRSTDFLSTLELCCLGECLKKLKPIDARWLREQVKLVKNGDKNNSQGALFEMLGIGYFAFKHRIEPAKRSQPGFDALLHLGPGKALRVSMKSYGLSAFNSEFKSNAQKAEAALKESLRKLDLPPLQIVIDSPVQFPSSASWQRLLNGMPGVLYRYKRGQGSMFAIENEWTIMIGPLPDVDHFSENHKSYTFLLASVYHANEHLNLESKLDSACANLVKHSKTEDEGYINTVYIHLPETASVERCIEWIGNYFEKFPAKPISGIFLYQPRVLMNQQESYIGHFVKFIKRPEYADWNKDDHVININFPVGRPLDSPVVNKIAVDGQDAITVADRYIYQSGNHYIRGMEEPDGSIVGNVLNPAPGIHVHAEMWMPGESQSFVISSRIFPAEHILKIL